jgi:hypothetical protein
MKELREKALEWWNNLPHELQGKYWFEFRDTNFTPSINPSQLTGREIQIIYESKK